VLAHAFLQFFEFMHGCGAGQHVNVALALFELVDEVATDETCTAGDEISHVCFPT